MIKLEGTLLSENYNVDAAALRLHFSCQFYLLVVQRTQRERTCYLKHMCPVKCYLGGTRFPDMCLFSDGTVFIMFFMSSWLKIPCILHTPYFNIHCRNFYKFFSVWQKIYTTCILFYNNVQNIGIIIYYIVSPIKAVNIYLFIKWILPTVALYTFCVCLHCPRHISWWNIGVTRNS